MESSVANFLNSCTQFQLLIQHGFNIKDRFILHAGPGKISLHVSINDILVVYLIVASRFKSMQNNREFL